MSDAPSTLPAYSKDKSSGRVSRYDSAGSKSPCDCFSMAKHMKIQLLKNKNDKWYWRIIASNGKILAHSESYSSKTYAKRTAWKVWQEFTAGNVKVEEI